METEYANLVGNILQGLQLSKFSTTKISSPTIVTKIMKALKCKPSAQFTYNYTINVSSKCGNIISHRSSVFEGRNNAIDLRRSAHISSIFESRHIDLRRSTHRSSKIEGRNIAPTTQHRTDIPTICHRILSTTALHNYYTQDSARYIRTVYITFI